MYRATRYLGNLILGIDLGPSPDVPCIQVIAVQGKHMTVLNSIYGEEAVKLYSYLTKTQVSFGTRAKHVVFDEWAEHFRKEREACQTKEQKTTFQTGSTSTSSSDETPADSSD